MTASSAARKFYPEKISNLINIYGHDDDDVAKHINMSISSFRKALEGERTPTYRQIKALAALYNVRATSFFSSKPRENAENIVDFRDASMPRISLPPKALNLLNDVNDRVDSFAEISQFLQLGVNASSFKTKFSTNSAKIRNVSFAHEVRNELGLDLKKISELVSSGKRGLAEFYLRLALENAGISVSIARLESDEFTGFFLHKDSISAIFVNTSKHRNSRAFTIGHELGHAFIGQVSGGSNFTDANCDIEKACNVFSANLLTSPELISECSKVKSESGKVTRLYHNSLLSRQAAAIAMNKVGHISDAELSKYFKSYEGKKTSQGGPPDYHGVMGFTFTHLNKSGILGAMIVNKAYIQGAIPSSMAQASLGYDPKYLPEVLRLVNHRLEDLAGENISLKKFELIEGLRT